LQEDHKAALPQGHMRAPQSADSRSSFATCELDYDLPEELIAQTPAAERGASRMLVVERTSGGLRDSDVGAFPGFLRPGDLVVLNDTRVVPARFDLYRTTGGRIEGLFLHEHGRGEWDVLLKRASRSRIGEMLHVGSAASPWRAKLVALGERGRARLQLATDRPAGELLREVGRMPLPPYIRRERAADEHETLDRERYQTVFAARDGAVAAPTAGLHFTERTLAAIEAAGARLARVTLHVGYGTFAPIEVEDLAVHPMHAEWFDMPAEIATQLRATRASGGRVIAVGTTSARVLESAWQQNQWSEGLSGWTDLFCYPPAVIAGVDALLTNFHLPRSTLLALVMAFAGIDLTRQAYQHAIKAKYRFYSYGDAMLIL
jgi:S-adenosylmethionine:tRNA ribosyltransferase-isomerase